MNRRQKDLKVNQKGNGLLFTTIMLLILSLIVASSLVLASMRYDLAVFKKNTNNTYYLAKSAIEKQVDVMNQALIYKIPRLIEEKIKPYYIKQLVEGEPSIQYNPITQCLTIREDIALEIKTEIYDYLLEQYTKEQMKYTVQSDRAENTFKTKIQVQVTNKDSRGAVLEEKKLRIIAVATTGKGSEIYDKQRVEAVVNIQMLKNIANQIHEKYEWYKEVPEILKSALLCYSDVWVCEQGELHVLGDARVGGQLVNETNLEVDNEGGVIAVNGGKIHVGGNVYCSRNILATNGWDRKDYQSTSAITIQGDAIAHTIGIVDDFYKESHNQMPQKVNHQVQNTHIAIGGNVMVDNDVMIDPWVKNCRIEIEKTLFGVGGGNGSRGKEAQQNSGVFAQGDGCKIKAQRMYVAGQPFVILEDEQKPMRLWESIGEPFVGVSGWQGYETGEDMASNASYLDEKSPLRNMIKSDKIETDFTHTYAVAKVSGIDTSTGKQVVGATCKNVFGDNEVEAWNFFFQGNNRYSLKSFVEDEGIEYIERIDFIIQGEAKNYLRGGTDFSKRDLGPIKEKTYEGLKGYMTLMRNILYQSNRAANELKEATLDKVINLERLPLKSHSWCYETPIEVIGNQSQVIKISDYYVDEGKGEIPYPTLIINGHKNVKIKLETDGSKDTLKGWIISAGPVELGAGVKIEGGILVGGPEVIPSERKNIYIGENAGLIVKEGCASIQYDPEIFLKIEVKENSIYRSLLDALYLTNYETEAIKKIMSQQDVYTKPALKYSEQSILEMDIGDIGLQIELLKSK